MVKVKNKGIKILLSALLICAVVIPVGTFFVYPKYSDIRIKIGEIDTYDITKKSWTSFLISISPPEAEVRGSSDTSLKAIEDMTRGLQPLERKILEERDTRLEIRSLDIKGVVVEGIDSKSIDRGFWHFPLSVLPGEKGNSVIIGHRFQYVPPARNTFYNLDKVGVGDEIKVIQDNDLLTYIVTNIEVVEKNDVSILEDTNDYRLTLVTCTPLWTSEKRLVITAKMDRIYQRM